MPLVGQPITKRAPPSQAKAPGLRPYSRLARPDEFGFGPEDPESDKERVKNKLKCAGCIRLLATAHPTVTCQVFWCTDPTWATDTNEPGRLIGFTAPRPSWCVGYEPKPEEAR